MAEVPSVEKLASPDVPAWICYVFVILVGLLSARYQISKLLSAYPHRWGFFGTWLLLVAHWAVPVVLFYFLDFAGALHDTSLFAALLVAIAYQQILAGGVQGIQMPGQTPRLWQPFEKWVTRVADGIATRQKRSSDKLEEGLRNYITVNPARTGKLHATAVKYSADAVALEKRLDQIQTEAKPTGTPQEAWEQRQSRARVDALLTDLRASKPEQYAELLRREKVFTGARYWAWFRGLVPKITGIIGTLVIIVLIGGGFWIFFSTQSQHAYFRWRFAKVDATNQDRFRSRQYFENGLRNAATDPATARQLVKLLLDDLRFKDISSLLVDDIARVIIDAHSPALDAITIPPLIEGLRTESPNVRLTIHRTLVVLGAADYQGTSLQDLTDWTPSKEESPGQVDEKVRKWLAWWQKASAGP